MARGSTMMRLSVTSRTRRSGGRPARASAAPTCSTMSGSWSWRAERLTLTWVVAPGPDSFATRLQASSMTQRPIGTISPVSSASGMKAAGESRPRRGWRQRTRASAPTIVPEDSSTMGW